MGMNDYCELHLLKQELKFLEECKNDIYNNNGKISVKKYSILSVGVDLDKEKTTPFSNRITQKYGSLLNTEDQFLNNIEEEIIKLEKIISSLQ